MTGVEATVSELELESETDDGFGERTERIAEVEYELREELEGVVNLPSGSPPERNQGAYQTATVTDLRRAKKCALRMNDREFRFPDWFADAIGEDRFADDAIEITVLVEGKERTFFVPWPHEPSTDHPAVRLCQWGGTSPRLLDGVPVVSDGEEWHLVIPPTSDRAAMSVPLPGGKSTEVEWTPSSTRLNRLAARIGLTLAQTSVMRVDPDAKDPVRMRGGVYALILLFVLTTVGNLAGLPALLIAAVFAFGFVFLPHLRTAGGIDFAEQSAEK